MEIYNGYFNKHYFSDFNLFVTEYSPYVMINEEVEEVTIEGRSGKLFFSKGTYSNRTKSFKFRIKEKEFSWDKMNSIIEWLTNIEDNKLIYDTGKRAYRVIRVNIGDVNRSYKLYYEFTVDFICEPFLTDLEPIQEEYTTKNIQINYLGNITGTPVIELYANGNIQLTTNGETIQIKNVTDYIKLDSGLLEVVDKNGISKDWDTIGNYPTFKLGINTIDITGNVTKVKIKYINLYR